MRLLAIALLLAFEGISQAQTRLDFERPEDRVIEKLIRFDPTKLSVRKIENRFVLVAEEKELKDFGLDGKAADLALKLLRDEMQVNQYAKIIDSQPPLEYWLKDGEAPRKTVKLSNFIPFDLNSLKIEKSFGVWMLRDRKQMLFSFGNNKAAADDALAICKKYRFNQFGYVGTGIPTMTYFMIDPFQGVAQKSSDPNPLEMLQSADRLGLILPEIGLVGPRLQVDSRRIEMVQGSDSWQVRYGTEVFGSFGKDDVTARRAMRLLQDYRVTEYVKIGKIGFPLFLNFGQPLVKVPLGFHSIHFKPNELNVKELNGKWYVIHVGAPLIEAGNTEEEAILLMKVIQFYRFDRLLIVGNTLSGAMRVLLRDR